MDYFFPGFSPQSTLIFDLPAAAFHTGVKGHMVGRKCGKHTEDVGNVWPTADIHPGAPGVSLLHCLSPRTAPCRSPQTFAVPAGTLPCRTPMGQKKQTETRKLVTPLFSYTAL